jgi:filamentous hemagglutinin
VTISTGSITDSGSSKISFGALDLKTTGIVYAGSFEATGAVSALSVSDGVATLTLGKLSAKGPSLFDTLAVGGGSIVDSSGEINFVDTNLVTGGTVSAGSGSQFGTLTLSDGLISDTSGTVSFGGNVIVSTALVQGSILSDGISSVTAGKYSGLVELTVGNMKMSGSAIVSTTGTIDFDNEGLKTTGVVQCGKVTAGVSSLIGTTTFGSGTMSDSTGGINFGTTKISSTATVKTTADINGAVITGSKISDGTAYLISGALHAVNGASLGTLLLGSGSITDSSGTISFNDEDLVTSGIVTAREMVLTTGLNVGGKQVIGSQQAALIDVSDTNEPVDNVFSSYKVGTGNPVTDVEYDALCDETEKLRDLVAELRATVNDLLSRMRLHGLIAT